MLLKPAINSNKFETLVKPNHILPNIALFFVRFMIANIKWCPQIMLVLCVSVRVTVQIDISTAKPMLFRNVANINHK